MGFLSYFNEFFIATAIGLWAGSQAKNPIGNIFHKSVLSLLKDYLGIW